MTKKYTALLCILILNTHVQAKAEKICVPAFYTNRTLTEKFDEKTRIAKLVRLIEQYEYITKNTDEKIMCNYSFFINDICATFSLPNFYTGYKLHFENDFKTLLADLSLIEEQNCNNSTLLKTAAIARMYIEKRIAQIVADLEENEQNSY